MDKRRQSKLYRPTSKSTVVVLRYVDLVHVLNHVVLLLWIRYVLLILAINRSARACSVHRTGHHVFQFRLYPSALRAVHAHPEGIECEVASLCNVKDGQRCAPAVFAFKPSWGWWSGEEAEAEDIQLCQ